MCYLANILTKEKFEKNVFYNITANPDELVPGIMTLIIGWETAKALHPEASILDWKIDENTFWTYGKRVKRERNENDIQKFKKLVLDRAVKSVSYEFFDVLTSTTEEKLVFFKFLRDDTKKFVLLSGDMAYIYAPFNGKCIGLSLSDIEYEDGDRKKILSCLYSTKSVVMVKERDFISYDTKELIRNRKYIIPYLSSIEGTK